jgi:hypothetical protein
MTVNEFIYTIREGIKEYVDDGRYSDSYLLHLGNLKRAFYIRREYNQYQRNVDADVLQTIAMELEEVDESMSPEFAPLGDLECTILRTVDRVPPTIELHSKNTIFRVGPVGLTDKGFQHVELNRFPHTGYSKYEKRYTFSTLATDGRIYIKAVENYYRALDYIAVTGLYENPLDVAKFDYDGEIVFDYDNMVYPIEAWMTEFIIKDLIQELAGLKQLPVDEENNSKDEND